MKEEKLSKEIQQWLDEMEEISEEKYLSLRSSDEPIELLKYVKDGVVSKEIKEKIQGTFRVLEDETVIKMRDMKEGWPRIVPVFIYTVDEQNKLKFDQKI